MPEEQTAPTILPRHRAAAWPYAPACYRDDPNPGVEDRWMSGAYDSAASIIRAFAEFDGRRDAETAAARAAAGPALAWARRAVETADDLLTDWIATGRVDHLEDRWQDLRQALTGSNPRFEELEAVIAPDRHRQDGRGGTTGDRRSDA